MNPQKIYYVEDDVDDAEILAAAFAETGIRIEVFPHPLALFSRLETDSLLPALIIMDINLPKMDGEAARQRLRADARLGALPIAMLSTNIRPRADIPEGEIYFQKPSLFNEYGRLVEQLSGLALAQSA